MDRSRARALIPMIPGTSDRCSAAGTPDKAPRAPILALVGLPKKVAGLEQQDHLRVYWAGAGKSGIGSPFQLGAGTTTAPSTASRTRSAAEEIESATLRGIHTTSVGAVQVEAAGVGEGMAEEGVAEEIGTETIGTTATPETESNRAEATGTETRVEVGMTERVGIETGAGAGDLVRSAMAMRTPAPAPTAAAPRMGRSERAGAPAKTMGGAGSEIETTHTSSAAALSALVRV